MNRSRRFSALAAILLIASFSMLFTSCRTSRQESRRPSAKPISQAGSQTTLSRQMDSLLIIEEKLLDVIDSMTGLVNADHSRIRALEREVRELSQANEAPPPADVTPLPPSDSPYDTPSGLAPPPPSMPEPMTAPAIIPPPPAISGTTASSAFQARYSSALREYNENNFESALAEFQSLERDDPDGAYSGNYKYWEGECYYAEKRYNMALQTFGTTLSQFPNSTKAAAAQFKIGECYEKLNVSSSARAAYERVIADYPSSEYKARAQARLNALR